MSELFLADELALAYKDGSLEPILKQFSKYINRSRVLGRGGDASVFDYDGKYVLKICHKGVGYFENFGKSLGAYDFANHSKGLSPYFVPVNEVLYDDDKFMVYTQYKCKILANEDVNKSVLLDMFGAVQFMFEHNSIASDLGAKNWGYFNGRASIIDYHGLKRYELDQNGNIKNTRWWVRIIRNLTKYVALVYFPHKRPKLSKLIDKYDKDSIRTLRKKSGLPAAFIDLIIYMYEHPNNASLKQLQGHIAACIKTIGEYKPSSKK